jgi:tetratricopeptide (TPR) repeat protein
MPASIPIASPWPKLWCACSAYFLGAVVLCGAQAELALGQQSVRLEGKVRTDSGVTLKSGVRVRVETREGELVAEQPVNSEGAFKFDSLPKKECRLIVTADGYEPYREALELGYGSTFFIRNISLAPLRKISEAGGAAEPRSDSLAPKTAKKEYEKGAGDLAEKNLEGAKTHLENAVREYPCYARAQTDLAAVLEQRHDLTGAEAALKKARECDPDYIDSYIVLGQMLNGQKRFSDSAQVLEEGVRRSPSSWQFYYQLGVAYYGLAQFVKAEREYQKVMELNPSPPPEFHVKLADVYLREKAYDKAYAQMDQYVKAEPNGRFATRTKNIMQEMKAAGILNQPGAAKK